MLVELSYFLVPAAILAMFASAVYIAVIIIDGCSLAMWWLCWRVWRFRTITHNEMSLHYAPRVAAQSVPELLLRHLRSELADVSAKLESRVRGRVHVYLFADHLEICSIFGPEYGGTALAMENAIVVVDSEYLTEDARHEFTHLLTTSWNPNPSPLLCEGLAGCLQRSLWGMPHDHAARLSIAQSTMTLSSLTEPKVFFSEQNRDHSYVLAASFSRFLIRRFDWELYRRLYRNCRAGRFALDFKTYTGISLEEAEMQWRAELLPAELLTLRLGKIVWLCGAACGDSE